jgi:Mg2+-importing ATPase
VPDFWSLPVDRLFDTLCSSPQGLSDSEAAQRLATYGPNVAAPRSHTSIWRQIAAQFKSPITILLLIAALLSLGLGERTDGTIILGILLVSGVLGVWQEHRAATTVEQLLALVRTKATVFRNAVVQEIPIEQVVPGDIVQFVAGDILPGDARLLSAHDLFIDQAVLTGESYPSEKAPGTVDPETGLAARANALYLGTHVASGTGSALVVHTGCDTEFGAVARRLDATPPETEFEVGIRHFGYLLLEITMVLVICIFAINVALHRPVLDTLLFTLALAVGLTPQLLPAIVSVTLSQGARHMAAQDVIVRRLASIEDLGEMEILCTDKTGTLTQGSVALHAAEDWSGTASDRVRLFAYLNAAFESGFPNPIDVALRALPHPGADLYRKVDEIPYDFVRKRLSVVADDGTRHVLITKGALADVLAVCDTAEDAIGHRIPIAEAHDSIDRRYQAVSTEGCRCLGVAYRILDSPAPVQRSDEQNLTFLGTLTFEDPLKPHVAQSLHELSELGIRVVLITGDNKHIAAHVATDAGLDATTLCTGSDLRQLSTAALVSAAPHITVFAEIEPTQKEQIILALKQAHYAVGYLGDGINDAAALHAADVGISVDSAAAVTKQAAGIVLLQKDLSVLGRGVREGRRAFANTLKYIFTTTSANFGNMFSMAGASLFSAFLPLLPKQILLINVLTDLPAMAVATDRLDPDMVARPRRWDTRSIRQFMITFGLVSSLFDYLTFGLLWMLHVPTLVFRSAWFMESVLSEVCVLLVIRTRHAFFRSRPGTALFWLSIVVGVVTVGLPYSPLAPLFGFAPLPLSLLGWVATIVMVYIAASEGTKRWIFRDITIS